MDVLPNAAGAYGRIREGHRSVDRILMNTTHGVLVLLALAAGAAGGCGTASRTASAPPIVQPGAPGEASKVVEAEQARDLSRVQFTPADVKFMQGMIHHHAQAVDMTELLATRTESEDMKK